MKLILTKPDSDTYKITNLLEAYFWYKRIPTGLNPLVPYDSMVGIYNDCYNFYDFKLTFHSNQVEKELIAIRNGLLTEGWKYSISCVEDGNLTKVRLELYPAIDTYNK